MQGLTVFYLTEFAFISGFGDRSLSHPTNDNEIRQRVIGPRSTSNPLKQGAIPDFNSDQDEDMFTRAVEADFEFLEHEEVDDMDLPKNKPSEKVDNEDVSYAKAGITSVSKWLGYE